MMVKNKIFLFTIVISAFTAGLFYALPANAISYMSGGGLVACPATGEVIVRVVTCVQMAVIEATFFFLAEFSAIMQPVIMTFIVLIVILFATRLMSGAEPKPMRGAFILIFQIGIVWLFANNLGGFTASVFDGMVQAQAIVLDTFITPYECPSAAFASPMALPFVYSGNMEVWAAMDCLLGRIMGYGPTFSLLTSTFGLLGAVLFGGALGMLMFFMGISAIISLLMFVFRVIYAFLTCYIYVAFLILLSPLIVPLLLHSTTKQSFNQWLLALLAGMALPAFLLAFVAITLPLIDDAMYETSAATLSLQDSILGIGREGEVADSYRNESQPCSMINPTDWHFFSDIVADPAGWQDGPLQNLLRPSQTGSSDNCYLLAQHSADFGEEHFGILWDAAASLLYLLLTVYLITIVMRELPMIAASIFGGGHSLSSAASADMPGEKTFQASFQGIRSNAISRGSQTRGLFAGGQGSILNRFIQ
jgi:hypothetical protein